jgi:hypothetical protein
MQNLRIVNVEVVDISDINVTFTATLTPNLVPANVSIVADTPNVPNATVNAVKVNGAVLSIACEPLTPLASYYLVFQSTPTNPFQSLNGDAIIMANGVSNQYLFNAPISPDNPIANYLTNYFTGNIYEALQDPNSVVTQYVNSLATNLARALYDIRQLKSDNYLELDTVDEQKVRGGSPFDRLNNEGAYVVTRVGVGPTNTVVPGSFSFADFPNYPVTLQRKLALDNLTANSVDAPGYFNINSLTLNLNSTPVTRVDSIVFTLGTANPIYTYNIPDLGYQIQNSRYDQDYGFTYPPLADNQIRLNDLILSDPLFSLDNILKVTVNYEYKDEGVVVDPASVAVTTVNQSIREVLPPIINVFSLQHAPITDNTGRTATFGGVTFIDPNQATPGALHPAFIQEIPFRLQALPSTPGVYAIDYSVGQVYVYGANLSNDGTGPEPPLATYNYLFTYVSEQDYAYDPSSSDLVALGPGNLAGNPGTLAFNYEQVLIPGIDYSADCHIEVINENVNNNLTALNVLKTQNSPITNVFQIFNETTGEIYSLVRWEGDKVYFKYNNPPNIASLVGERAVFNVVPNELLFVNTTTTNASSLRIFKIFLNNNTLVAGTEDTIGSSFNTSLNLSNGNVFVVERWFNREQDEPTNLSRLVNQGDYMVDYTNGIVYVVVSQTQQFNIGSITYKNDQIVPANPNLITVNDIYYRISPLQPKNAEFGYDSFGVGSIVPSVLNYSDELYLNNTPTAPYLLINNSVGVFVGSGFVPGVTYQVKYVRSVFEYDDLLYNTNPINFANASTSNNFNISVGSLVKQSFESVQFDGTNYYVILNENVPFLSPNITFNFTITRVSDNTNLWSTPGTIVPGSQLKLILSPAGSPHQGDLVNIGYSFTINNVSRVVVDYNKGDYFIDYSYVADQLLVSYEYGDNQLDFRNSNALSEGDVYYCSYKSGALRNTLLQNFGTLVNVPELANVDLNFNRQRYREALQAALSSFIQGPTVGAIKNIGTIMSHIEPEVIESAFQAWTLGTGLLNPEPISTTGDFTLLPAKFGNGVLVNQPGQTITFPANSNLRLEAGTFETWIAPQWNGLDNDATLTFNIKRNGQPALAKTIFIGASEYHPTFQDNGTFSVNKNSEVQGLPNLNKDGIFIYYAQDYSGNFNRWYVQVVDDGYSFGDGYVDGYGTYQFVIQSTGTVYDNKSTVWPKPPNVSTFTGTNTINLTINGTGPINNGITFLADPEHYLMDLGQGPSSRLSIYKDASGYMNFRAIDKNKQPYTISYDCSSWKAGQLHQVAASWKLNTINNQDEMHFFIDGFEVPNIIKYGQKLQPYFHEKFRTVDPEEFVGLADRDIVGSIDLVTTINSNSVTSSINFTQYNIFPGDTIYIDEIGFNPAGYTIDTINGQQLLLNAPMPTSLTNGRFSINRTSYMVTSEINVVPNIAVSTIHAFIEGTDGYGNAGSNYVSSLLTNFSAQGVQPGYMLRLDNPSLPLTFLICKVTGNTLMINGPLPINISSTAFQVYSTTETELPGVRALVPDYSISQDANFNNILTISNGVFANDLILLRTLGLNFKGVDQKYYVWSDEIENIIRTQLPSPISLDEVDITKIILPTTAIGPANSTLVAGTFVSNNLPGSHPSNSQSGRTLSVVVAGTNANFSNPVQVTINGYTSSHLIVTETISFNDYGTLNFSNNYITVNYIQVNATPINPNINAVTVQVREMYPLTHSEFGGLVPVVKYSYHIGGGYNLYNDTPNSVRDDGNLFSGYDVGNYLLIQSPATVAGFYQIVGLSPDRHSVTIEATAASYPLPLVNFTGGVYQVLNVTQYRSGLQNGMFTFESSQMPGVPYLLHSGWYEFDYNTYASIKFQPLNTEVHIGTDFAGNHIFNGIINEMKTYSIMLTDTRVGETSLASQRTITKDFNSLKPLQSDINTLMLVTFNSQPFVNSAKFYATLPSEAQHFQSSDVVNDNFGQSLVITDNPLVISNSGILDTQKQGTIEFWMNPLFDTSNDPNYRYYFDAYGAVLEQATSVNDVSVKITGSASQILSVKLLVGDQSIDYFAGGKLEIDTQRAIQEETVSLNAYTVTTSQPILQVITVKISGDPTGMDYFQNGSIGSDGMTIYLGQSLPQPNLPLIVTYQSTANKNNVLNTQVIRLNRKLPNQNTPVVVNYIPKGLQGDRLSIFKDPAGYMNFLIHASGSDFVLRAPVLWARNTWHRVKATYQLNGGIGNDSMMLFLDGYQWTDVPFGSGAMFGPPNVWGQAVVGDGYGIVSNIIFKDPINELYIGSDYTENNTIFSLIDNFRISDLARPVYAPYGEPLDVNYTSNLSVAFPVTQDLYTTYLLDFNSTTMLNTQFATIKNRKTGLFDFTVNILDSFGIVSSSILVQDTLNTLINTLKPANSRAFIQYIT